MATATWEGLETVEGIIKGMIHPETLPFAQLSVDEQEDILHMMEKSSEDIAAEVLEEFPDLNDEVQRNERLKRYRAEFMRRADAGLQDVYGSYYDAVLGVCIRNGCVSRSCTIDDSGCATVTLAAA